MLVSRDLFLEYLIALIKRTASKLPETGTELEMMEIAFSEIRHVYTAEICAEREKERSEPC